VKDAASRGAAVKARTSRTAGQASHQATVARFARTPLALAVLALGGAGISAYLTATHYGHKTIACAGLGQCDYVNSSEYARIAGLPVSVLGLLLYGVLLVAALAWLLRPRSETAPVLYWGVALSGAGYAAYLTYVELGVLHAICVWCVASAMVLATSLAVSTAALLRKT
jgi:uncharacterized membrane protein